MSAEPVGTPASNGPPALPFVQLFTDGACQGNPGPGGWGYILRHPATGKEKEASGGAAQTTNNQMEMQAVIEGLKALAKRSRVEIITDSSYVAKGSKEWMPGWKANGWRRRDGKQWKPVKNVELWKELDELLSGHMVKFTLVKGHAGHPENERCDQLAVEAATQFREDLRAGIEE
jgi:ribonuclease HI